MNIIKPLKAICVLILILFGFYSCKEQKFSTKAPIVERENIYSLQFSCNFANPSTDIMINKDISGNSKTKLVAEGQICLSGADAIVKEPLNILFIIDISGSMKDNDPTSLFVGKCGRLDAINAIVNEIQSQLPQNNIDAVKFGIITFSDYASINTNFININEFKRVNLFNVACGADGWTNYQDAFNKANSVLSSVSGKKVIYFLSDGEPTMPYDAGSYINPNYENLEKNKQAGLNAANNLKFNIQKLILNVIFLDKNGSDIWTPVQRQQYLAQIASDPSRVKIVNDAKDLAKAILEFEVPSSDNLSSDVMIGTVEAPGYVPIKVEVEYIKPDPLQNGVYIFKTKPFSLHGEQSKTVINTLKMSVNTSSNTPIILGATIKFTRS